jgi:cell division protein FtsW
MILAIISILLLLLPQLSFTKNGATRWLRLGPLSFQPAELLKLATVAYLAMWFERRGEGIRRLHEGLIPFSIMLFAASFVIVVLQRDMGTMMVLALSALGMYFIAGAPLQQLGTLLAVAAGAAWLGIVTFPHRLARLTTFLNPERDPTGQGYHITQALVAIGTGGLFGVGLGKSIQVYGYLP